MRDYRDLMSEAIEALPSAHHWTPASDALPLRTGIYLVCSATGTICTAFYLGARWSIPGVVAWMCLPEPYKEDDHE